MRKIPKISMLTVFGLPLAVFGYLRSRGSAKDSGNWLRNSEGVVPAHQRGVRRGDERSMRAGAEPGGDVAGRRIGSVAPS